MSATHHISFTKFRNCIPAYLLLYKWLQNYENNQWLDNDVENLTLKQLRNKYHDKLKYPNENRVLFIKYKQKKIGLIEFFYLTDVDKKNYELLKNSTIVGIQLFIGIPQYRNQGFGTEALKKIVLIIKRVFITDKIAVLPDINNSQAIRCFEKAGFKKIKSLTSQNWLMIYDE